MPDEEGYPTEEELNKIENWDASDPEGLLDFIEDLWCYTDGYRFVIESGKNNGEKVIDVYLSTGGWSGNESIIAALRKNIFWSLYWQKSERGGHYWFKIINIKK
ncbi:MAG: hypothetical protein ACTSUF_04335 [Candidatus Heimdallarchaeaceae archaeon]